MEHKNKVISKIIEDFLIGESEATDMRIMSIRHFLSSLDYAVDKYLEDNSNKDSISDRKKLVVMLDDIAEIYRNEISDLLVKRGKLKHYLDTFKDVSEPNIKTKPQLTKANQDNYIN